MKVPELLSPAGCFEALKAAVENGADAVYLGGKEFNARRGASNFDRKELKAACEYAHLKGVNVYVTVNILISDREMEEAGDFIEFLYSIGVDGIIVQDLGLGFFIKSNFKEMELHGSTQMTIHNLESAMVLEKLNFDRVVLARELSLDEIREIKEKTNLKIETFVHGALCFCYSGQCLMSSFIGARSGNRGQCAQPCRLPYILVDEKEMPLSENLHLLSPRDLNMIEHLPSLIEAGIDSFKIEGRLKRPEYVAQVTALYRKAIDNYLEYPEKYKIGTEDKKRLLQIFNRDFTTGYYFYNPGSELMSIECPRNKGIYLGKVAGFNKKTGLVKIKLAEKLRVGDGIDFRGEESFGYTVTRFYLNGKDVKEAGAGSSIELKTKKPLPKGTPVYKTSDALLLKELRKTYQNHKLTKKIPVDIEVTVKIGQPLEIRVIDEDGNVSVEKADYIAERAEREPLNEQLLKDQINRLGNTVFRLRNFRVDMDDGVIVPFSAINETRRKAVRNLEEIRIRRHLKPRITTDWKRFLLQFTSGKDNRFSGLRLSVRVDSPEAARVAVSLGADMVYFGGDDVSLTQKFYRGVFEMTQAAGREFYLVLPRIIKSCKMAQIKTFLRELKNSGITGIVGGNLGILYEAKNEGLEVVADFSLNTFNSLSFTVLRDIGVKRAIVSTELNLKQIKDLSANIEKECIIHGRIPLMVSEHDLISANLKKDASKAKVKGIKARLGKVFPVKVDEDGRTHIYNCYELCMINYLKELQDFGVDVCELYLPNTDADRVKYLVSSYVKALRKQEKIDESEITPDFTHGHFFRGVM